MASIPKIWALHSPDRSAVVGAILVYAAFTAYLGVGRICWAQTTHLGPTSKLEARLFTDGADGRLDDIDLLDAALIASGVDKKEIPKVAREIRVVLSSIRARASTQRTPYTKGMILLQALHDTVFRRYRENATNVRETLRTGEYNCVSSAILFLVAARDFFSKSRAMLTPYHAFVRVEIDGKPIDVETTHRLGFDPDRKKIFDANDLSRLAGRSTTMVRFTRDIKGAEALPVLSLIAAVYNNRGAALAESGDRLGALLAFDRAAKLARGKLKTRTWKVRAVELNRKAVLLLHENRFHDAKWLLERSLDDKPAKRDNVLLALENNLAAAYLGMARTATELNDFKQALKWLDEAERWKRNHPADWSEFRAQLNGKLAALEGSSDRCQSSTKAKTKGTTHLERERAVCLAQLSLNIHEKPGKALLALQYARKAVELAPEHPKSHMAMFFSLMANVTVVKEQGLCDAVERLVREADAFKEAIKGQTWQPNLIMGNCWVTSANRSVEKKNLSEAASYFARALVHMPQEKQLKESLGAIYYNQAVGFANQGQCDDARPIVRRATLYNSGLTKKSRELLEACTVNQSKRANDRGDYEEAARIIRRGLVDNPSSEILSAVLGKVLHNIALEKINANQCAQARTLLPELKALRQKQMIKAIEARCPKT